MHIQCIKMYRDKTFILLCRKFSAGDRGFELLSFISKQDFMVFSFRHNTELNGMQIFI
jgi:hypothetical protein